ETETEAPLPEARSLGLLERPADGDTVTSELKIKGWILTNEAVGEIEAYVDLLSGNTVTESFLLGQSVSGDNTFEKRRKKYETEIAAAKGYEVKLSQTVEGIPDGSYDLRLRVVEPETGAEEILGTVKLQISGGTAKRDGDVLSFMGLNEEEQVLSTHYIYEDKGFAIGMDADENDPAIQANANQILLTGWINANEGTSLGMFFDIDDTLYTADTLAEQGGEFAIIRVPRDLEQMDSALVGDPVRGTNEAGCIVSLKLPFLDAGAHTIAVSFNVGVPGEETEIVDIRPVTVWIDPSVTVREDAIDRITEAWEKEFPQPETETKSTANVVE
ncbi:MAG: hypothetical protein Q4E91_14090, partial [Lachnospiraceae bacterium]|nr:hypothetical protein [Lachnospiraceae bacterium]